MSSQTRVVELDRYEYGAVLTIINEKRTNLIRQRQDAGFVNEILEKILKAPCKKNIFVKKVRNER